MTDRRELLHEMIDQLKGSELTIAWYVISRIDHARAKYGVWDARDGRDYREEALQESVDRAVYETAWLIASGKLEE